MKKIILLFLVFFSGIILSFCAHNKPVGSQTILEKSGSRPSWITEIPESKKGIMFFRGLKTNAATLDGGINDARHHALQQIAEMVSTEVNVDYERARVEYGIPKDDKDIGSVVRDAVIALSQQVVKGAREKESYYEKIEEITAGGVHVFFNVYMLVHLSEEDLKRTANEVIEKEKGKARDKKNKKAEDFLENMRKDIIERDYAPEEE
ncbi:MAG TPA: hypothetical protein VII00_01320 [bacterium]